jgi:hypothetical protein
VLFANVATTDAFHFAYADLSQIDTSPIKDINVLGTEVCKRTDGLVVINLRYSCTQSTPLILDHSVVNVLAVYSGQHLLSEERRMPLRFFPGTHSIGFVPVPPAIATWMLQDKSITVQWSLHDQILRYYLDDDVPLCTPEDISNLYHQRNLMPDQEKLASEWWARVRARWEEVTFRPSIRP